MVSQFATKQSLPGWTYSSRSGPGLWSTVLAGWCPMTIVGLPAPIQGFLAVVDGDLVDSSDGVHSAVFDSAVRAACAAEQAARSRSMHGDAQRRYRGVYGNGADLGDHEAVAEKWLYALTCPWPPSLVSPRPAPLDVRAMGPTLRAATAEDAMRVLTHAVVDNARAVADWLATNWGPGADLRGPQHPARVAARDPSSPPQKLADAQAELAAACRRYRARTGRDGLALARHDIARLHSAALADQLLKPLAQDAFEHGWNAPQPGGPAPLPPALEPTLAQRRAAAAASAEWLLSSPDMGDLADRLEALLAAYEVGNGHLHGRAAKVATAGVRAALAGAIHDGCSLELLQTTLDMWTKATDGPRIIVRVGSKSSA
jgi:hypothetical protein